jgi:hypothetical protein
MWFEFRGGYLMNNYSYITIEFQSASRTIIIRCIGYYEEAPGSNLSARQFMASGKGME